MAPSRARSQRLRLAAALFALVVCLPGLGSAHATTPNGFEDHFDTLGPLAGTDPGDAYEIKSGSWRVVDNPKVAGAPAAGADRVLEQESRATNVSAGGDPIVFVRNLTWRSFTAQVTAAFLDAGSTGDPVAGSSVGIAFRAPVHDDGLADADNLYLFTSVVTGVAPGFPTGKGLVLFKRVGRTYYLDDKQVVPTWADLTQPHEYKVTMTQGHIQCFFDGRLVIDRTDVASPDQPTAADPLPGLPIDGGTVGLRTSGARAVFDDFKVYGNDAYEGRAAAIDGLAQYGQRSSTAADVRRGAAPSLSQELTAYGANQTDTGFVYHDHAGFDDAIVRPVDNPTVGGGPLAGAELRTVGSGDTVTSTARLLGVNLVSTDPTKHVSVTFVASTVETIARANCAGTSSDMNVTDGNVFVQITDVTSGSTQKLGPFPLTFNQDPNTTLVNVPGTVTVIAHARYATDTPDRIEVDALKIVFYNQSQQLGSQGSGAARTPALSVDNTPAGEVVIGRVVAGRYCS